MISSVAWRNVRGPSKGQQEHEGYQCVGFLDQRWAARLPAPVHSHIQQYAGARLGTIMTVGVSTNGTCASLVIQSNLIELKCLLFTLFINVHCGIVITNIPSSCHCRPAAIYGSLRQATDTAATGLPLQQPPADIQQRC
jgi:hypothetical protein